MEPKKSDQKFVIVTGFFAQAENPKLARDVIFAAVAKTQKWWIVYTCQNFHIKCDDKARVCVYIYERECMCVYMSVWEGERLANAFFCSFYAANFKFVLLTFAKLQLFKMHLGLILAVRG